VEACNDVQVAGVLKLEGSGADTRIGFQNGAETMEDSTCVSCGHCVTVCPTGSLVEKGIEDATTIPLPGFTQKNSIGKTHEQRGKQKGPMTPKERTASNSVGGTGTPETPETPGTTETTETKATTTNTDEPADPTHTAEYWRDEKRGEWP